jgi:lysozyme family protein
MREWYIAGELTAGTMGVLAELDGVLAELDKDSTPLGGALYSTILACYLMGQINEKGKNRRPNAA